MHDVYVHYVLGSRSVKTQYKLAGDGVVIGTKIITSPSTESMQCKAICSHLGGKFKWACIRVMPFADRTPRIRKAHFHCNGAFILEDWPLQQQKGGGNSTRSMSWTFGFICRVLRTPPPMPLQSPDSIIVAISAEE